MRRILLVDEDLRLCGTLARSVGPQYEVVRATIGMEALNVTRRQPVALVVLEYRLRDMSGLALLAQIKATRPRLPVIMITAYGSEWACASALKLGVRDYFIKPVHLADLAASIHAILSGASSQQGVRKNVLATNTHLGKLPSHEPTPPAMLAGRHELAVRGAVQFIQEHYWETISLPQVAREVGLSKFALSRKFRAVMNVSFREYLVQLRVMKARELLQRSRYSVTEIAQMVGFGDLPRFDKVFKHSVGVSPSAYRVLRNPGRKKRQASGNKLLAKHSCCKK